MLQQILQPVIVELTLLTIPFFHRLFIVMEQAKLKLL